MTVFDCGEHYNIWVECACSYALSGVPIEFFDNLVFLSTAERDACRIAEEYRKKEIILLSDRILPKGVADEGDANVRYFIFTVLHEIVHAFRKHRPPNSISQEEHEAQERKADEHALEWFNQHIRERNNPYMAEITMREVNDMRERNQELMERLTES